MSEARRGPPQIVVVGAVTEDRFGSATRPGGAAPYTARALEALGIRARMLVSAPPAARLDAFASHDLTLVRTTPGLYFDHELDGEERRLRVLSTPDHTLTANDLPASWRDPDALILTPLLPDDIDIESFVALPMPRIALLAQGMQRHAASDGAVTLLAEPAAALFAACDERTSVFLSLEEVAAWPRGAVEDLSASCACVVLTRGADGADVYRPGHEVLHVDASPATPIDTTGAGDAFAAAFTATLACGASDERAGALAARVAAATVEHAGPVRLPDIASSLAAREGAAR